MTRQSLGAGALVLLTAVTVSGNGAPPIWSQYDRVTLVLEMDEELPEFTFYLYTDERSPKNGQEQLPTIEKKLSFGPGNPLHISLEHGKLFSIVVRRDSSPDHIADLVYLDDAAPAPSRRGERDLVLRLRVKRSASGDGVEFKRIDEAGSVWVGLTRSWVAVLAASVGIVGIGVWLVRRRRGTNSLAT